MTTMTSGQ